MLLPAAASHKQTTYLWMGSTWFDVPEQALYMQSSSLILDQVWIITKDKIVIWVSVGVEGIKVMCRRSNFFIWNPHSLHIYKYGWVHLFYRCSCIMFFSFLSLFCERPGRYLWWASFSYNWIEALPTARQDLVKLKVLLDCCYLCADSVTAVTTAAACQGLSPRIPPLITVFIGN